MQTSKTARPRKLSSIEKFCLLLVIFLSLMHSVAANRIKGGKADEIIEEGHLIPGGFSARNRPSAGVSRKVPFWWPTGFSVATQAFLRQFGLPVEFAAQSPTILAGSSKATKRASHHTGSEKEHSNPQIPTTGVRAPRGAHEYDVPQIECPNAEDGMERFACPTPDTLGRYRCIDDHVLCDGFLDCPDGSDEDRHSCMFYKTTKAHLDVLADALLRWARGRYNK